MRYEVRFTNQFKKDLKLAQKQGKDTAVPRKVLREDPVHTDRGWRGSG